MTAKDVLKNALKSNHEILSMYLSDLSDADLLVRPAPGANHIAWQLGHLIYSERKSYAAAAREYQTALDLDRYLPAAWYNWGNDLLVSGDYPSAVKRFTRSLRLYPTDVWALNKFFERPAEFRGFRDPIS